MKAGKQRINYTLILTILASSVVMYSSQEGTTNQKLLAANSIFEMHCALSDGADINTTDKNGDTALHDAVRTGDIIKAHYLLENRANVDQANKLRSTPLFCAMHGKNQEKMIELLMLYGADHNCIISTAGNQSVYNFAYFISYNGERCSIIFDQVLQRMASPGFDRSTAIKVLLNPASKWEQLSYTAVDEEGKD